MPYLVYSLFFLSHSFRSTVYVKQNENYCDVCSTTLRIWVSISVPSTAPRTLDTLAILKKIHLIHLIAYPLPFLGNGYCSVFGKVMLV